ncbi:nucleotide-binding universal stress UspA family protein [Natronocella acetinitrilica]|uniref:Nucleotide-binding universal stress UspA family protein n=1 Tax=Natronocella acetinitrilica TaxID=414046 RepID=A0AAE3G6E4_9GAMM|nr:universal stress protein [Natronocella acetinitrilica]MCP1675238.1 nucleotide-binding universal stress UspA family protein [Natronocella acetinitrilica]
MTNKVTVPVDWYRQSLKALAPGHALAEQLGAELEIVSVVPSDDLRAVRESDVNGALRERGLQALLRVLADTSPAECLAEYCREQVDSLFCLATHARGAAGETIMGSVAFRVLRDSGRPMVMIGPALADGWGPRVDTVMVCLDGSTFAESLLEPAAGLALQLGARLRLLQVFNPEVDATPRGQDSAEWAYLRRLAGKIQRDKGITADWETLHGKDAGRAITDYAAGLSGGMLALTTHGRTGAARVVMGGVAQSVCRSASVPVLLHCPMGSSP